MSFLPPNQQNQDAAQGPTTNAPNQPPPTAGGSAGAGAAPKAGSSPNTGSPNQFGSSASKLGDYLSANAPQISQEANTLSSNLNTQYGQVGADITNGANQFGQSVSQGYTAPNQSLVDQAAANPTGFASDPNNVSGFQAQYNNQYTGPQNYESTAPYASIQNEVSNAVQNAGNLKTPAGLSSYFSSNNPNASRASSTLDQLLLSNDPTAQPQIMNAASQFSNLVPQFQNSVTSSNALVPAAQQAAQAGRDYAHSQIGNTTSGFNKTLQEALSTATAGNQGALKTNNDLTQAFGNNDLTKLTPDQLKAVGLTAGQAAALQTAAGSLKTGYNTTANPLSGFFTQGQVNGLPTLANVATAPQYQEDAALAQLLGQNYTPQLNPGDASQAGSYAANTSAPAFNSHSYANQLESLLLSKEPNQTLSSLGGIYGLADYNNGVSLQRPGTENYRTPEQLAAIKAVENLVGQNLIQPAHFPGA